ncbi:dihydrolipoamide acetyltransferase family protein [Microaerobacter geothermalis]|uniref:dihydrolipoamide acetyltransferase family protein n=1 Tax=Microaerobacter geothermalis TaxID=674972 RepID=UPI0022A7DF89|nr:dihydrolipoamide acetyltransferase family protein [Microaerobacter geothermalis]
MANKILMPQLGESVTEGTISKWLVKKGDLVKKYDPLCEVMTDKVNAEVPSTISGTVGDIVIQEGETVSVGEIICYIEAEGEQKYEPVPDTQSAIKSNTNIKKDNEIREKEKLRYSPAVLKLAQEHNLDLTQISGTGRAGRITRKDVLASIEKGVPVKKVTEEPSATGIPVEDKAVEKPFPKMDKQTEEREEVIPVSGIRKVIANRMVQSKHEAPHAWTMVEADVTNLVKFREQKKDEFKKKEGVKLTFLPFFIKAVVEALKEYPILNSVWNGDQILIKKDIHISIAVATEDALFVPVIHHADQKSILGLAKSIDDLVRKTREGKLTTEDIQGGTFTVNNTGSFGSVLSAPIINIPQAAILSLEAIVKRPVVYQDMIAVRDMVNICLSLDHRVLDGLVCGKFLQSVKQKVEAMGPDTKLY